MRTYVILTTFVQVVMIVAQDARNGPRTAWLGRGGGDRGYGGLPFGKGGSGCAENCVSSYWETAEPTPTAFCDGRSELQSCLSSACAAEAEEYSDYSERSSSLCNKYLSCDSTGIYTYTYHSPNGDWPFGGNGWRGSKTWPTGEVVVTGCPWHGDGWGFPFWTGLGYGDGFWDNLGPGWQHATVTTTVHGDATDAVYTIEKAVSDDVTTVRTVGLEAATTESGSTYTAGASAAWGYPGVKVMGIVLGVAIGAVGLM